METFWAREIENSRQIESTQIVNLEVVKWLSKNLRKRPFDKHRRYRYINKTIVCWNVSSYRKIKAKVGVRIYDQQDAILFKMRWL